MKRPTQHQVYVSINQFCSIGFLTCCLFLFQNCGGGFSAVGTDESGALGSSGESKAPIYQCKDPSLRGASYNKTRRLSKSELSNTLRDLLGATVFNDTAIQVKLSGLQDDQIKNSPADFFDSPNTYLAGVLFDISVRAAELLAAAPAVRASVLDSCTQVAMTDDCVRKVVAGFGQRVLRRKPTAAETDEYVNFYTQVGGGIDGLQLLVIRFLQSPSLVFHLENGNATPNGSRFRLTDYEIASRISYLTAGTMPDSELFGAADRSELQDINNVRLHVKRLLALPAAKTKIQDFFKYYTQLHTAPVLNPAVLAYAQVNGTGLGSAMQQETFDFLEYIFWTKEGNFNDLMTSTAAFPKTAALADILDAPLISVAAPVSQSLSHIGLFHRPALLSNATDRTSPILRGAHIRKMYLCDELGAAPADAIAARENELGDISNMPNRDRTDLLTQSPACIGCHSRINNLGFTFEKFSPLGKARVVEPLFDAAGAFVKNFPIDTNVSDPKIETSGPARLNDSVELVNVMAKSKKAQACFAKKVFEFYKVKRVNVSNDSCLLSESSGSASVLSLQTVIVDSIANEDIFWRKDSRGEP